VRKREEGGEGEEEEEEEEVGRSGRAVDGARNSGVVVLCGAWVGEYCPY